MKEFQGMRGCSSTSIWDRVDGREGGCGVTRLCEVRMRTNLFVWATEGNQLLRSFRSPICLLSPLLMLSRSIDNHEV